MRIQFTLVPVERIRPWGTEGNFSLSWFGLTDGQYWIQAGESLLFEYSHKVRSSEEPRYCDYQVVRLYEDLLDILPYVLEPVPKNLVQYISDDQADEWQSSYEIWCDQNDGILGEDQYWEIIETSKNWRAKRLLDSHYLSPSANILMWSDTQSVYIEWDNRDKTIDGNFAWTAIQGKYELPRSNFIEEIQSFHFRLMDEMGKRVEQVCGGALRKEIKIDLLGLKREHEHRCKSLENALNIDIQTDWQRVEQAINEVLNSTKRAQA